MTKILRVAVCLMAICVVGVGVSACAKEKMSYDFSKMSGVVVCAQVGMMIDPATAGKYVGKSFKISGVYRSEVDGASGETRHFIVIADALSCCIGGLPFEPLDGVFVPTLGTSITVEGVYVRRGSGTGADYILEVSSLR
jgi:hypothetical protein